MIYDAHGRLVVNTVPKPADRAVTATGAASAAVTLTVPAPTRGLFIHLTVTDIVAIDGPATVDSAVLTTTNLPGDLSFMVGIINNGVARVTLARPHPLRAVTDGAAVTIIAPAITDVIWRLTVEYYLAPVE